MAAPKTSFELLLLRAVKKNNHTQAQALLINSGITIIKDDRYFDYHLILKALHRSNIALAKLFVEKGFRVYKPSEVENNILKLAVCLDNVDFIDTILEKGAYKDILTTNQDNRNPFHISINRDQIAMIDLFLHYYNVETLEKDNNFLQYAVKNRRIEVIKHLVKKSFSVKKKDEKNCTPCCVAIKNKNIDILKYLVSSCNVENINFDDFDDVAPIFLASRCDNLQVIEKYLDNGFDINNTVKLNDDTWQCLVDFSGFTLLHFAVMHNNMNIFEFLLNKEADIFIQSTDGSSPLHIAFEMKETNIWDTWLQSFEHNNSMIDSMLKINLKFNFNPENKYGLSHFHVASSRDDPAIIEHYLKLGTPVDQSIKPDHPGFGGFTPLHFAAKFKCTKTLELLLKNGADVKKMNAKNMTALHIAAKEECVESVRLLLQYGADISLIDSEGNSPLHNAFKNKNYEVIDLLLSVENAALSNPTNAAGVSHFHISCTRNNAKVVENFIKSGVPIDDCVPTADNKSNWSGYTPLHFAVGHNRAKIVELLLRNNVNVHSKDSKGLTPLHLACQYNFEIFGEFINITLRDLNKREIIELKVKPVTYVVDDREYCPYGFTGCIEKIDWHSNRKSHIKIINLLVSYGRDVNILDNNGNTPVFYAYGAVTRIKSISKDDLNCFKGLFDQIIRNLFKELLERRKLILDNFLKLHVNLDECHEKQSLLHSVCSENGEDADEWMEKFLKKGANVNAINEEHLTPLHQATLIMNKNLVCTLLDYGADVNCVNPTDNTTPLLIATSKSVPFTSTCLDIINILITNGANINAKKSDGTTVLHNLACKKAIVYYGNPKHQDITMLVSNLIKAGANVNSRDSNGYTPLYIACLSNSFGVIDILLNNGADINIEDNEKKSVFCLLYEKGLDKPMYTLQVYYIKMNLIGFAFSSKVMSSYNQFIDIILRKNIEHSLYIGEEKQKLIDEYEREIQALKSEKINANCTLFDVIFKSDNDLSKTVQNFTFKAIVQSRSFQETYPHYGYLIRLRYQTGIDRANLLPIAYCLFNKLSNLDIPAECFENICKYFTNDELKESTQVLSKLLNFENETTPERMQLRMRRPNKRQRVNQ